MINKFIHKLLLMSFPILGLLLAVNYFGDAANLYGNYETQMVQILENKKFVTNIKNYNERIFQKQFIASLNKSPDNVVLGSSRTRSINTEILNNGSLINNSVSGASIEDLLALFQLYKDVKRTPKNIIIGIDPWMFNDNNDMNRWKSISDSYHKFKKEKSNNSSRLIIYKELLSLSYFQSSLVQLFKSKEIPTPTLQRINSTNTMMLDGSNVQSDKIINSSNETVNIKVNDYLNNDYLYGLMKYESISENKLSDLKLLIKELKSLSISVNLILSPYHPKVYNRIEKEYKIVLTLEDVIVYLAKENDIKLLGSFNPKKIGVEESDFFDGMHCFEKGVIKTLKFERVK